MPSLKDLWTLFETVQGLLKLEKTHGESISDLKKAVADIDRRVQRLENREDVMVNEAKAAARAASHEATQGALADIARRLGRLEGDVETTRATMEAVRNTLAALPAPKPRVRKKTE